MPYHRTLKPVCRSFTSLHFTSLGITNSTQDSSNAWSVKPIHLLIKGITSHRTKNGAHRRLVRTRIPPRRISDNRIPISKLHNRDSSLAPLITLPNSISLTRL